jgi:hypothetical protein
LKAHLVAIPFLLHTEEAMWKIFRWQFTVAVVVLLLGVPFADAQNGEKAVSLKMPTVKDLRDALSCEVTITENAQVTLPQGIKLLEKQARDQGRVIAIDFDANAIAKANEGAGDVETTQVRITKRDHPILLRVALQEILNQFMATNEEGRLAYAIVEGRILVAPPKSLQSSVLRQPVSVEAEAMPLRKLLKQLADQTGVNLVLDPRIKEEPKVTIEVHEVSLNTAIRLLAEMTDLTAIRTQEDVYFITTKERADRLRKEQGEWNVPAPGQRPKADIGIG